MGSWIPLSSILPLLFFLTILIFTFSPCLLNFLQKFLLDQVPAITQSTTQDEVKNSASLRVPPDPQTSKLPARRSLTKTHDSYALSVKDLEKNSLLPKPGSKKKKKNRPKISRNLLPMEFQKALNPHNMPWSWDVIPKT